jgi:hypothetical protein
MLRFPSALLAAATLMTFLFAAPASADETPREYIYGAELMTPAERDNYRNSLQQAPTDEARGEYRQRHRQRLQERARQHGKQLDERGIVRGRESQR